MAKWTIEYDNDTGPDDEAFVEWWDVSNGERSYRCTHIKSAQWLADTLNDYARGIADGLERAAEFVKTADMADPLHAVPLHAVVLFRSKAAKLLRDEAAKIRKGK